MQNLGEIGVYKKEEVQTNILSNEYGECRKNK